MSNFDTNNIALSINNSLSAARALFNKDGLFRIIDIPFFDCSILTNTDTDGKNLPEVIKDKLFKYLHQYDNDEKKVNEYPCLYVFELYDEADSARVVNAIKKTKETEINRILPAIKSQIPCSKYLYVGKVLKEVGGRLVTHLGYYQTNGNHGLQLAFWAREMSPALRLKITVLRFEKEMTPYMSSFEKLLAVDLNPIIGKHG